LTHVVFSITKGVSQFGVIMIKAVKGFKDILPDETPLWREVEEKAKKLFEAYGYSELRIPVLEKTELFKRSLGVTSDIVEKEMYTFEDKGGESLTLRPEATASIARAYLQNGLFHSDPVGKYYFFGPMFRHERPQAGRLRQFYQLNVEAFGALSPTLDAEVICLLHHLYENLELLDLTTLEVNSLGCEKCRPKFREELIAYLETLKGKLCPDCERRRKKNPLRVFDCKNNTCKELLSNAPSILDALCDECKKYFDDVLENLEILEINFTLNPRLVRGLDYYCRTVFELTSHILGAQNAVAAGGRYDGLLKQLGEVDIPGIGFAVGMERTILLLEKKRKKGAEVEFRCYIAALGDKARKEALKLSKFLRSFGIKTEISHEEKSLKSQMRKANKIKAKFTLILGDDELSKGVIIVRDMVKKEQKEYLLNDTKNLLRVLMEGES